MVHREIVSMCIFRSLSLSFYMKIAKSNRKDGCKCFDFNIAHESNATTQLHKLGCCFVRELCFCVVFLCQFESVKHVFPSHPFLAV